ncbi:MAG: tRNA uridine-5-carboxymethylaminomethyl(34) synthesis GTPase MnmE, partial [Bacteroidetes bacterium]|nr:tRNA uridine-5-carboxymethylaminomethyl(34) synthesis GTPase MnmE [Bacteroidota bacterium]
MLPEHNTIIALATPPGVGALGLIRLSGPEAISIVQQLFSKKNLAKQAAHSLHFGRLLAPVALGQPSEVIDEVVLSLFRAPQSYTGEDVVELSCHGSAYILQRVLELCVALGAVPAKPGEFTQRAFLNGKLDLTQAEAVGDLIAAESRAAQQAALHQLRGGFSQDLKEMREELIHFSALMELELDFSQEDVEFADRTQLNRLLQKIDKSVQRLIHSFRLGNAVKNGVSVAIIGAPNAGKSTLLNALLNEERAIVSDIAGTTRDTIEERLNIGGMLFRFIDTAGIRAHTDDLIEQQGIARSKQKAEQADIVLYLLDAAHAQEQYEMLQGAEAKEQYLVLINKSDLLGDKSDLKAR